MTLRRFFDTDATGQPVDPAAWYEVRLLLRENDARLPIEYVSGQDLLTCAQIYDQLMSQGEDDNDDDNTQ